jgi:quinol monooxygenase YgiN
LTRADVGFYDNDANFVVEQGEIEVYVGASSAATAKAVFTVHQGHPTLEARPRRSMRSQMIFITAKFRVRPESADRWPEIARSFTEATREEPGCLWFDWSRSLDDPNTYVLVEAFRDGDAGGAHVRSAHFKAAQQDLPPHLAETPRIVNMTVPQEDWSLLGELSVDSDSGG